jgi:hypothetical protein
LIAKPLNRRISYGYSSFAGNCILVLFSEGGAMKLLRSVVIGLVAMGRVGWYLIIPPFGSDGAPVTNVPVAQWIMVKSFESAAKCESALSYVRRHFDEAGEKGLQASDKEELAHAFAGKNYSGPVLCIASNDPRLE